MGVGERVVLCVDVRKMAFIKPAWLLIAVKLSQDSPYPGSSPGSWMFQASSSLWSLPELGRLKLKVYTPCRHSVVALPGPRGNPQQSQKYKPELCFPCITHDECNCSLVSTSTKSFLISDRRKHYGSRTAGRGLAWDSLAYGVYELCSDKQMRLSWLWNCSSEVFMADI